MSTDSPKYQFMPPLSEHEYEALFDSIAKHGVLSPIIKDEAGNILEGHNRATIASELGTECPEKTVEGTDRGTEDRTCLHQQPRSAAPRLCGQAGADRRIDPAQS